MGTYGSEGSLQEVTHSRGRTLRLCVAILDTCKLEQSLRGGGSDETGSSWRRDETAHDGTDLSADFGGHCVGLSESSTPVSSSDRDDGQLGEVDGAADGSGDFLCALDTQSDVAVEITDGDESLEARPLTRTSLLLHRHDLHNFILELGQEEVDNLVLLNGE